MCNRQVCDFAELKRERCFAGAWSAYDHDALHGCLCWANQGIEFGEHGAVNLAFEIDDMVNQIRLF